MTNLNCDLVRDAYPDILNGNADAVLAERVRAHIATCDDCRAETALLDSLHAHQPQLPPGLHERVVGGALAARRRWRFSRLELLLAATLAAALIGGAAIMQLSEQRPVRASNEAEGIGFVSVDAAMMTGKTSLDDLSVEELEKLLGEIES